METIVSRERQRQAVLRQLERQMKRIKTLIEYKADPDSYYFVQRGLSVHVRKKKIPTAPIRH